MNKCVGCTESWYADRNTNCASFCKDFKKVKIPKIRTINLTNKKIKLKAKWSIEEEQDIQALHGIDIEKELVNVIAKEILQEIDHCFILQDIIRIGNNHNTRRWK